VEMYLLSHHSKKFLAVCTHPLAYMSIEDGIQRLPILVIAVLLGASDHLRYDALFVVKPYLHFGIIWLFGFSWPMKNSSLCFTREKLFLTCQRGCIANIFCSF